MQPKSDIGESQGVPVLLPGNIGPLARATGPIKLPLGRASRKLTKEALKEVIHGASDEEFVGLFGGLLGRLPGSDLISLIKLCVGTDSQPMKEKNPIQSQSFRMARLLTAGALSLRTLEYANEVESYAGCFLATLEEALSKEGIHYSPKYLEAHCAAAGFLAKAISLYNTELSRQSFMSHIINRMRSISGKIDFEALPDDTRGHIEAALLTDQIVSLSDRSGRDVSVPGWDPRNKLVKIPPSLQTCKETLKLLGPYLDRKFSPESHLRSVGPSNLQVGEIHKLLIRILKEDEHWAFDNGYMLNRIPDDSLEHQARGYIGLTLCKDKKLRQLFPLTPRIPKTYEALVAFNLHQGNMNPAAAALAEKFPQLFSKKQMTNWCNQLLKMAMQEGGPDTVLSIFFRVELNLLASQKTGLPSTVPEDLAKSAKRHGFLCEFSQDEFDKGNYPLSVFIPEEFKPIRISQVNGKNLTERRTMSGWWPELQNHLLAAALHGPNVALLEALESGFPERAWGCTRHEILPKGQCPEVDHDIYERLDSKTLEQGLKLRFHTVSKSDSAESMAALRDLTLMELQPFEQSVVNILLSDNPAVDEALGKLAGSLRNLAQAVNYKKNPSMSSHGLACQMIGLRAMCYINSDKALNELLHEEQSSSKPVRLQKAYRTALESSLLKLSGPIQELNSISWPGFRSSHPATRIEIQKVIEEACNEHAEGLTNIDISAREEIRTALKDQTLLERLIPTPGQPARRLFKTRAYKPR